jgi:hypothetical protein
MRGRHVGPEGRQDGPLKHRCGGVVQSKTRQHALDIFHVKRDTTFVIASLSAVSAWAGTGAAEVASQLARDVIAAFVKRSAEDAGITWRYGFHRAVSFDGNRLHTAIKLANRAVFRKAGSSDDYTGMGTTIAAVIVFRHAGRPRQYPRGPRRQTLNAQRSVSRRGRRCSTPDA